MDITWNSKYKQKTENNDCLINRYMMKDLYKEEII